jgi:sugar O-acyltransferase (sialic acid O-acetyltransferase NeuD family)
MKKLIIVGAGGFGREVLWLVNDINKKNLEWKVVGFLDDDDSFFGKEIAGIPVLGKIENYNNFPDAYIILAIGQPTVKCRLLEKISTKAKFATLIHPSALIGERVEIGSGCIICAYTVLTVDINIGQHVILNLCCTIGHDTRVQDFSSFMPSVNISGEVEVETGVYIGTGAKIINQVSIGNNTIIGAGAVVSRSIPPNCTAVGIPAKPIKFH